MAPRRDSLAAFQVSAPELCRHPEKAFHERDGNTGQFNSIPCEPAGQFAATFPDLPGSQCISAQTL